MSQGYIITIKNRILRLFEKITVNIVISIGIHGKFRLNVKTISIKILTNSLMSTIKYKYYFWNIIFRMALKDNCINKILHYT